ncbi:MAG: 4Fe-4S dicluster domain-containing protein [Syntrophomonadaceae bacterium]|nr:4Fe-4S dicluster domain-containing protein [Syntrophomonadaceae bacterium]
MAYGLGLLKGMWVTLKHTFEKKDLVVQYPEQRPVLQERFRGTLCFRFENCIACNLCVNSCPNKVLSLDVVKAEGSNKRKLMAYIIDMQYCMYCNLCVESCNSSALYWNKEFEKSTFDKESIKITYERPRYMDELEAQREAEKERIRQEKAQAAASAKKDAAVGIETPAGPSIAEQPKEILTELAGSEENITLLLQVLSKNTVTHDKLLKMIASDMEKAKKVALALVQKALRDSNEGGKE